MAYKSPTDGGLVLRSAKREFVFTKLSSLLATMEANRLSPASSEMRKMYSGAVTWLDRCVRPVETKKKRQSGQNLQFKKKKTHHQFILKVQHRCCGLLKDEPNPKCWLNLLFFLVSTPSDEQEVKTAAETLVLLVNIVLTARER